MSKNKLNKKDFQSTTIVLNIDIKNCVPIEFPKVESCWCCHAPKWARCHDCKNHKK